MKSNLKSAYILTNAVLVSILKDHLSSDYNTDGMTVRFTGNNAVLANITPKAEDEDDIDPELYAYQNDEDEDEDDDEIYNMVVNACTIEPRTASQIAEATGLSRYDVDNALSSSEFAKVAPARENGQTVSMFMRTGTTPYDNTVAKERNRIIDQVVKFKNRILVVAPGPDESGANRPDLVQEVCDQIQSDHTLPLSMKDDLCEELRRDARSIFYAMAESQDLYHAGNSWKRHRLTVV